MSKSWDDPEATPLEDILATTQAIYDQEYIPVDIYELANPPKQDRSETNE